MQQMMGGGGMGGMNPMSTGRVNVVGTGGNMGMDLHRIPVVGNMFQNPYDQFKQQQMQNAAAAYSMYRPEAQQAWMNAQNQQSAALQPMNNAIESMYGPGSTQGFEAQNPFGPTAFSRGAATGTDPQMPQPPGEAPPGGAPQGQHPAADAGSQGGLGAAFGLFGQLPGMMGNAVTGVSGPMGGAMGGAADWMRGAGGTAAGGMGQGFGGIQNGMGNASGWMNDTFVKPWTQTGGGFGGWF